MLSQFLHNWAIHTIAFLVVNITQKALHVLEYFYNPKEPHQLWIIFILILPKKPISADKKCDQDTQ